MPLEGVEDTVGHRALGRRVRAERPPVCRGKRGRYVVPQHRAVKRAQPARLAQFGDQGCRLFRSGSDEVQTRCDRVHKLKPALTAFVRQGAQLRRLRRPVWLPPSGAVFWVVLRSVEVGSQAGGA